jgi:glycosyltransferase involved in cell wall biosynthesis
LGHIISILADDLRFLGEVENLPINGAQISTVLFLRQLVQQPWVEAIEYFVAPDIMAREGELAQVARSFLPPERRGQGVLRFYPFPAIPEVWSDGAPRNIFCFDPEMLPVYRYVRDRFAVGPAPICADTHTLGHYSMWQELSKIVPAPPTAFDSIVCRAPSTAESLREGFLWLQEMHGLKGRNLPCRLDVTGFGIDLELFHPHSEDEKSRARRILNLPQNGQIAMYFGRVTPHSKADLMPLLRAFCDATQNDDDYLLIAGTPYPETYAQQLRETGNALALGERLIIHGHVEPQLRPLYFGAADVFVFPADNIVETWGNTMCEAMASGLPVIASDWDGLSTHMKNGENGFLIPTWWMPGTERVELFSPYAPKRGDRLRLAQNVWVDTVALTDALRTLLSTPEARRIMGENGRRIAEENYNWNGIMKQWRALWDELEGIARAEPPHQAQLRREYAPRITLPIPYLRIFRNYATGTISPERHYVRLSQRAKTVLAQDEGLGFHDDIIPLLRREVTEELMRLLKRAGERWISIGDITRLCSAQTGVDDDLIRFHLGLFLKHALVEIGDEPTNT